MAELYSNHRLILSHSIINSSPALPLLLPLNPSPRLSTFPFLRSATSSRRRRTSSQQFLASSPSHSASSSTTTSTAHKIDIVSTTKRSDGSFVFEFGEPSVILESKKRNALGSTHSELREERDLEVEEVSLSSTVPKQGTSRSSKSGRGDELDVASDSAGDKSAREIALMLEEVDFLDDKLDDIAAAGSSGTLSLVRNPTAVKNKEALTSAVETSNDRFENDRDDEVQAPTVNSESDDVVQVGDVNGLGEDAKEKKDLKEKLSTSDSENSEAHYQELQATTVISEPDTVVVEVSTRDGFNQDAKVMIDKTSAVENSNVVAEDDLDHNVQDPTLTLEPDNMVEVSHVDDSGEDSEEMKDDAMKCFTSAVENSDDLHADDLDQKVQSPTMTMEHDSMVVSGADGFGEDAEEIKDIEKKRLPRVVESLNNLSEDGRDHKVHAPTMTLESDNTVVSSTDRFGEEDAEKTVFEEKLSITAGENLNSFRQGGDDCADQVQSMTVESDKMAEVSNEDGISKDAEEMKNDTEKTSHSSSQLELVAEGCNGSTEIQEFGENSLTVESLGTLVPTESSEVDDNAIEMMADHAVADVKLIPDEEARDYVIDDFSSTEESQSSDMENDNASPMCSHDKRIDSDIEIRPVTVQDDQQLLETAQISNVDRVEELNQMLSLSVGAASLRHPSEALAGATDAYFMAGKNWFGIANGVSQWSLEGVKSRDYAQELLKSCEDLVLSSRSNDEVSDVRDAIKQSAATVASHGLASVLIAHFDNQVLHVANVGDTGYITVRNGAVHRRSSPGSHEFNLPLQIGMSNNPEEVIEEHQVELEDGDVIITATDGLFDNLYEQHIVSIVTESLGANLTPKEVAQVLAKRAQEVGRSTCGRSPFADAAQAAGYTGYTGGKPDHVTVIVSLVEKSQSSS